MFELLVKAPISKFVSETASRITSKQFGDAPGYLKSLTQLHQLQAQREMELYVEAIAQGHRPAPKSLQYWEEYLQNNLEEGDEIPRDKCLMFRASVYFFSEKFKDWRDLIGRFWDQNPEKRPEPDAEREYLVDKLL